MQQSITTERQRNKRNLPHPDANLRANGLGKCYNMCEKKEALNKAPSHIKHQGTRRNVYNVRNSSINQPGRNLQAFLGLMTYSICEVPRFKAVHIPDEKQPTAIVSYQVPILPRPPF